MTEVTVETKNLTKIFTSRKRGTIEAVKELEFQCERGEIFGLLGPNGAGKTTTLRMLSTILTPTQGTASIMGHEVKQSPRKVRSAIGFLATETGLYEGLTPHETLEFFGRINGVQGNQLQNRIDEVVDILDMQDFVGDRVSSLSTGMKQKLSLARSIIHDPPVLLFDEPTYGLDVMTSKTVTDYIRRFKEQGKTIVLSTHLMNVAEKLCDRIGILHEGKLKSLDTLHQLLSEYEAADLESVFFKLVDNQAAQGA